LDKLIAWSFSRWSDYELCPFKAKCKHILRLREPSSPALENGTIVHRLAEQHVRGDLAACPPELEKLSSDFEILRQQQAMVEQEWAFDQQWQKVAWFAPSAWLRIKVDVHFLHVTGAKRRQRTTVVIVDHKTGKEHAEAHALQRALYALGGFLVYPDAQEVHAHMWYLDAGTVSTDVFKVAQLEQLKRQWLQRTRAMLSDVRFAPRPGHYCRWCHYRKENGGPCVY
jgi:RecB family exonuclease